MSPRSVHICHNGNGRDSWSRQELACPINYVSNQALEFVYASSRFVLGIKINDVVLDVVAIKLVNTSLLNDFQQMHIHNSTQNSDSMMAINTYTLNTSTQHIDKASFIQKEVNSK